MKSLVIDIKDLLNRAALDKGYEVIATELDTHLNPMTIQLKIRPIDGGDVSIEDCALLNTPIRDVLDKSELLPKPYLLEISSPGISESLQTERDFETFQGFPVQVKYLDKSNSEIQKKGLLQEKSENDLKLNCKGRITIIPLTNVREVRLTTPKG